jgi:hypothetical protein
MWKVKKNGQLSFLFLSLILFLAFKQEVSFISSSFLCFHVIKIKKIIVLLYYVAVEQICRARVPHQNNSFHCHWQRLFFYLFFPPLSPRRLLIFSSFQFFITFHLILLLWRPSSKRAEAVSFFYHHDFHGGKNVIVYFLLLSGLIVFLVMKRSRANNKKNLCRQTTILFADWNPTKKRI